MRSAVVIVSFDSPERLRRGLSALSLQSRKPDGVIIVNTGTKGAGWAAREFPTLALEVLETGRNIGPAGGFRAGAKRAYLRGFDYVIFADDDAYPVGDGVIANFASHAEKGEGVVAGHHTNGTAIGVSNHYMMVSRNVLRKTGFYFEPFFLMVEDHEFTARLKKAARIAYDPGIVIDHPWRLKINTRRSFLIGRNSMINMAMHGGLVHYAMLFYCHCMRAAFTALALRKPEFALASAGGYWQFACGMAGPVDVASLEMELEPAGAREPDRKALWIVPETEGLRHPAGMKGIEAASGRDFTGEQGRGGPLHEIRRLASAVSRLGGRDLIIQNQYLLAFPPFSMFASNVYLYDELGGRAYLFYRNSAPLSALFTLLFSSATAALLPLAAAIYLVRRGHYKRMLENELRDDLEFCREADKSLRRGVPG